MTDEERKLLLAWLNDAHAMERSQEKALERFIGDFDDRPSIQDELQRHLEETRQQAEDVAACIKQLDGKVSAVKSVLGNISGALQGIQIGPLKDEKVKSMLLLHAGEHFEHVCYVALAAAARELDQDNIAEVCEHIAEEEHAVADWALEQVPNVVRAVVREQALARH